MWSCPENTPFIILVHLSSYYSSTNFLNGFNFLIKESFSFSIGLDSSLTKLQSFVLTGIDTYSGYGFAFPACNTSAKAII